jgi:hypothetical protein
MVKFDYYSITCFAQRPKYFSLRATMINTAVMWK